MSAGDEEATQGSSSAMPSPAEIARILGKRKLTIAFAVIALGMGSLGFASLLTPQYMAKSTVLIDSRTHNIVNMKDVTANLEVNPVAIESEAGIIHSTQTAGRVIDDLRLGDDPELTKADTPVTKIRAMLRRYLGTKNAPAQGQTVDEQIDDAAQSAPRSDSAVLAFLDRLTATEVGDTLLIEIGYKSRDPEKAARIANAVADAYVAQQIETKQRAAERATVWLQRQIGDLRDQVFKAEKAVSEFKIANKLYDTEGQPLDERQVSRQMEQLTLAHNTSAETRARYETAKRLFDNGADVGTIGDVLKSASIVSLKVQYADSLRQEAAAAAKYGPLHPAMLKAKSQVDSSRAELRAEIERIIVNLKSEADVAANAQAQLEGNLAKLKESLNGDSAEMVRLHELQREAAAAREVYESFLKRAQETTEQQNLQVPEAHLVDRATVPGTPISPKKLLIVGGGFGGGLALGLAVAFILEMLFPSFVRAQAIERTFKLRHLATVERFDDEPAMATTAPLRQLRGLVLEPYSVFAEQIRAVRVAVERQRQSRAPQMVLVTSALPLEGKTVVASNLALHFALSGVRTLLIDCDLRGAGLTSRLSPGAAGSLYECVMARQSLRSAIIREAATGLHFLPGTIGASPAIRAADLFASPVFASALHKLRSEFEIIIIDACAIVPTVEARILADTADQIVFVHKWRDTAQAVARQALRDLGASLVKVTGVVVNQVERHQLGNEAPLSPPQPQLPRPPAPRLREPQLAA